MMAKRPLLALSSHLTPEAMRSFLVILAVLCLSAATPAFAVDVGDEAPLPVQDETARKELPDYPVGSRISLGTANTYETQEEDTFLDIARHFSLGYVELRTANPGVDPWSPAPGTELLIPAFQLLPRAKQKGIVVNLGKMRLYYFKDAGKPPLSYPIGIGREGLQTPTGETTVARKSAKPTWFPTERMRKEKPWLPESVPAGAANPLGAYALYLGWPTFLIHGSNKPWGIGRRVSSGCMRMYPEDIAEMFGKVPVGTPVTVVDQPVLIGWVEDTLYLEANPTQVQSSEIEGGDLETLRPLTDDIKQEILKTAGTAAGKIDWRAAERALRERRGYPVAIAGARRSSASARPAASLNN